jgi:hypothetical protein
VVLPLVLRPHGTRAARQANCEKILNVGMTIPNVCLRNLNARVGFELFHPRGVFVELHLDDLVEVMVGAAKPSWTSLRRLLLASADEVIQ